LLVVLVIVGILILLALLNLMPLISRAKSTKAQLQLEHLYTLEKNYFYMNSKYSDKFGELGFDQEKLTG
jgi:type IV pilus assembly protein PilE